MIKFWINSDKIRSRIYIPKFYDPEVTTQLDALSPTHDCIPLRDLITAGTVVTTTGDEIGKAA